MLFRSLKDRQPGMDQKVEFWNHARMYEPSRPQDEESSNQTIYALQRIVHHEIVFEIEIYVMYNNADHPDMCDTSS